MLFGSPPPSEDLLEFLLFALHGAERRLAVTEELVRTEVWSERAHGWAFVPREPLSNQSIHAGLKELRRRGYLRRLPGKRWSLTQAGIAATRDAHQHCFERQRAHDAQRGAVAQAKKAAQAAKEAREQAAKTAALEDQSPREEPLLIAPSKRSRLSPLAERLAG